MTQIFQERPSPFTRAISQGILPRLQAVFDGGHRELAAFAGLALVLIVLRSAAFTFWEETFFTSDEAIIGLMAKHLSEGKTFPLFFYGQNYMLGVQSWILAPFFWIVRPSVTAMRLPLLALNAAAAVVLLRGLVRETGARPAIVFVALLPFILPPPFIAADLLDGNGCGAGELFLYVAALWALRGRPLAFGVLLAVAYLHREFTLAVLPALVVVGLLDRSLWSVATVKGGVRAVLGFALAWIVIDDLRLHFYGASLALQAQQLFGGHLCYRLSEMPQRLLYVFTDGLSFLLGAGRHDLTDLAISISARSGAGIVGWALVVSLLVMIARLAWNWRRRGRPPAYPVYLFVAGLAVLCVYPLACNANIDRVPLVRYLHLALLVPGAIFVIFMHREARPAWRGAALGVFLLAASVNLVDTVSVLHTAWAKPGPGYHRQLANLLMEHRIRYARAGYWDAYVTDFFTREKVIVGSTGKVRIPEYESAVDAHPETSAFIERFPCQGGIRQSPWCIILPDPAGIH